MLRAELGVWDPGWASSPLFPGHPPARWLMCAEVGGWVLVVPLGSTLVYQMRKPPIRHFCTVLAASPPHARRRALAAIAGVVLVVALAAVGVVMAVQSSPRGPVSTSSGHKSVAAVSGGELIATLSGPGEQVESLAALSPDGKRLAMFSYLGHETCQWDPVTRKVTILTGPGPGINGTAGGFSSGGTTLVVADTDGRIYLWDLATKHLTATLNGPDESANPRAQVAYSAAAVSPDGSLAAVATGGAGQVDIFDLAAKRQTATLKDPGGGYVRRLSFSPDGMLAIGDGGGKGNVYLWNEATRKFTGTVVPPVNRAQAQAARRSADAAPPGASAVFSPDGMSLATTAAYGYGTYLYDVANRKLLATLTGPGASTSMLPAVAFSPDGLMMAVVESNGCTYLWRLT